LFGQLVPERGQRLFLGLEIAARDRRRATRAEEAPDRRPQGLVFLGDSNGHASLVLGQLLVAAPDRDGLGRAALGGEHDLLLAVALGVDDDGDALVVEIEGGGGPERAVPRSHALVAV